MEFKLGRFVGYKPDIDSVDILKAVFRYLDKGKTYDTNSSKLHKFFWQMKSKYPQLFQDVYFNNDEWLPYSREIERAFIRCQEDDTIKLELDFDRFRIFSDDLRFEKEIEGKFNRSQLEDLRKIAKEFEFVFQATAKDYVAFAN